MSECFESVDGPDKRDELFLRRAASPFLNHEAAEEADLIGMDLAMIPNETFKRPDGSPSAGITSFSSF